MDSLMRQILGTDMSAAEREQTIADLEALIRAGEKLKELDLTAEEPMFRFSREPS